MEHQDQPAVQWSVSRRLAFRFAFVYFILYYLPFPFGALPRTGSVAKKYDSLWYKLVPWIGKHVLHLRYEILTSNNCSGDTTYEYVRVLFLISLALAASLVWSFIDRSTANYQRLYAWLRSYVRLSGGAAMLMYGAAKIFLQHFPPPNLYKLLEPLGHYSQMSLLWTFTGASRSYTVFAGSLQLLAGILLFVPRLTALGALIGIAVFSNIFALNLGYDLPVKLYSLHILLVCFFLLLPDARRLMDLLVLKRAVVPSPETDLFHDRRLNVWALAAQLLLGGLLACTYLHQSHTYEKQHFGADSRPLFYGIWTVDEFVIGGQTHPPLTTDRIRWQRLVFQFPGEVGIQSMDGSWMGYWLRGNLAGNTLEMGKLSSTSKEFEFRFSDPDSQSLTLRGYDRDKENKVWVELHRVDEKQFALLARGPHWIDEDAVLVKDKEGVCDRVPRASPALAGGED